MGSGKKTPALLNYFACFNVTMTMNCPVSCKNMLPRTEFRG
jgi:hypothetical protein